MIISGISLGSIHAFSHDFQLGFLHGCLQSFLLEFSPFRDSSFTFFSISPGISPRFFQRFLQRLVQLGVPPRIPSEILREFLQRLIHAFLQRFLPGVQKFVQMLLERFLHNSFMDFSRSSSRNPKKISFRDFYIRKFRGTNDTSRRIQEFPQEILQVFIQQSIQELVQVFLLRFLQELHYRDSSRCSFVVPSGVLPGIAPRAISQVFQEDSDIPSGIGSNISLEVSSGFSSVVSQASSCSLEFSLGFSSRVHLEIPSEVLPGIPPSVHFWKSDKMQIGIDVL